MGSQMVSGWSAVPASAVLPRPQVVILGAGFGGLATALGLANGPFDVTIVDKQNHHVFQPLLYQVATASLSPADIAAPIRSILKHAGNVRVLLDCVESVEATGKRVHMRGGGSIAYDWLIVATGAQHGYLGHDEWKSFAPGLKTIDDAIAVRRNVLLALERAEVEEDKIRRNALLTFVIIGGGPTGVELAGAIAELARQSVSMEFRHITPHCSRIILIDSGERVLKTFPRELSEKAHSALTKLGVEVKLGMRIDALHERGVMIGDEEIAAATIVWAAGVTASPAATWLKSAHDGSGRVVVDSNLHPEDRPEIFVIGDTASCANAQGTALPGVAAVAKQQGEYVAQAIRRTILGKVPKPFRYRSFGNMATIGRKHAVADFGSTRVSGFAAWLLWSTVHIYFLVGFRNRFAVGLNWLWNYLSFHRGARLITGLVDGRFAPAIGRSIDDPRPGADGIKQMEHEGLGVTL